MEEFQNNDNDEDEETNKPILNLNNQQVIKYANGQWTTNDTTFIGNEPSNLLNIQVNDNEKGTMEIDNLIYNIKNIQNGSIYSEPKNGRSYRIFFENFSYDTLSKNSNIVNIPHNQPRGTLFTTDDDEIIPPIMTFKVPLTKEAKLIIEK